MADPVGTVDGRFSDAAAQAMQWDAVAELMREAMTYSLCTVRKGGRPHATPLAGVWRDNVFYFCTGEDEQKARNLDSNRRVVVIAGTTSYEGADVVIEGDAERVTEAELLEELAAMWNEKYDDMFGFEAQEGGFGGGEGNVALVFAVRARKVFGFAKRPTFAQTRFRFPRD